MEHYKVLDRKENEGYCLYNMHIGSVKTGKYIDTIYKNMKSHNYKKFTITPNNLGVTIHTIYIVKNIIILTVS